MKNPHKVYRIRDVAERAGVSKATVSRVINNAQHIAPETRARVLEVATQLNYYRNAHARQLAEGRSDFFGLLISDIENPVYPQLIKGFELSAAAEGFDLLLCITNYNEDRTRTAIRKMIENRVRGVAVMTSGVKPEVAEELAAHQMAVVFLDFGNSQNYISTIQVHYSTGVGQAVDHLQQLGHRNIVLVSGLGSRRSAAEYRRTVVRALRKRGLAHDKIVECDHTEEGGAAATRALLGQGVFPTAILCINDLVAVGTISALTDAGLRVPEDVSVIGCEDLYLARLTHPPLTTIRLDRTRLGELAFEVLRQMLKSKVRKGTESVLETELVLRQSTGVVRTHDAPSTPRWEPTQQTSQ